MRLAFEPLLKGQCLAAPCDHPSSVEVHKGWHESFFQFWWEIEVKLYIERVDTRVSNAFHDFLAVIGLKHRIYEISRIEAGGTRRGFSISMICKR